MYLKENWKSVPVVLPQGKLEKCPCSEVEFSRLSNGFLHQFSLSGQCGEKRRGKGCGGGKAKQGKGGWVQVQAGGEAYLNKKNNSECTGLHVFYSVVFVLMK